MPLTQSPGFWAIIGYAALFGVVLAFAGLAFLGAVTGGTKWFKLPKNPSWGDGHLWWVAVAVGAGLLVGVLRRLFRIPATIPGTIQEVQEKRADPAAVPAFVATSLVSLVGGASLGPEAALGKMGGGLGSWISERRRLGEDERATNTLTGMAASFGGLLASPVLATIMIVEVAPLKVAQFTKTLIACLVSSTIAFAIYYAIAGDTFLGVFAVPAYSYKDWHLLAAIPLGLAAGVLALIVVIVVGVMKKLCAALVVKQPILIAAVGGLIFGLVGVALPLTMTTGTGNLPVVIHDGTALGAGLLIAVVFGKLLAFGVCEGTGFLGGPVLVSLFIGGTAGSAIHALIPGVPEGLAFTAMFAALPGALLAAPFSLILLAAITTNTSGLHIAPVAIAVITAYLAVSGTGTLRALAERGRKSGHGSPQPGESNGPGSHPAPAG